MGKRTPGLFLQSPATRDGGTRPQGIGSRPRLERLEGRLVLSTSPGDTDVALNHASTGDNDVSGAFSR